MPTVLRCLIDPTIHSLVSFTRSCLISFRYLIPCFHSLCLIRVVSESLCSHWLLYKGRYAFMPPKLVKACYNILGISSLLGGAQSFPQAWKAWYVHFYNLANHESVLKIKVIKPFLPPDREQQGKKLLNRIGSDCCLFQINDWAKDKLHGLKCPKHLILSGWVAS